MKTVQPSDTTNTLEQIPRMKVVQLAYTGDLLALHLAYVKRGGTVRIVDQHGPVADLVPISDEHGMAPDDDTIVELVAESIRQSRRPSVPPADDDVLLAVLEQQGLVRRGACDAMPDDLFDPGPEGSRARVLDALLEERRGSR